MNKQFERYLKMTLIGLDLLTLNVILIGTRFLLASHLPAAYKNAYDVFWLLSNTGWLFLSFILRTYADKKILSFVHFTKRTIQVYICWIILLLVYLFFFRALLLSRLFIIITVGGFGIGLVINRFLYLGISHYFKGHEKIFKKVLILGFNDTAKKLTSYLEREGLNTKMMGYIEDADNVTELSHYPVLADIRDTLTIARQLNIEEIYSTITPEQNHDIYGFMDQSEQECIRFMIVPDLSVFVKREVHIEYFEDLPILSLRREALNDVGNRFKKRILDIAVSVPVTLFILSWLLPLLGILILIESGRPVFFKQLRTGRNLKPFACWKLRSMKVNKEANLRQATANDSRVTRLGRFLRKTSLDEFPQFINVLTGEMSLVGPRPHMLKHTKDYSKIVDDYAVRQFLKPGITGWAQINGYRGEITNEDQIRMRVSYDLWYMENWTLWLDIQILFLTIYTILKGDKNAY